MICEFECGTRSQNRRSRLLTAICGSRLLSAMRYMPSFFRAATETTDGLMRGPGASWTWSPRIGKTGQMIPSSRHCAIKQPATLDFLGS
jgi:hypothetical protein